MPYIETYLIGDDNGEGLLHTGAIRFRVTGVGNLDSELLSLDETVTADLAPLALSLIPGKEQRILSNFISQRVKLRLSTDEIDEYVNISRIILFIKPIWSEYPG
jgi:hypothetical protein